ncbi:hypothetical protein [Flavobacterium sp. LB1P71]|uniref:hypothetical protein n=1 Tax=unclassified Flavobacterium TaxID=196869 RepID=UPI003AACE391
MKHFFLIIIISFLSNSLSAQTIQQIDSVATKMCESLSGLKNIKDDVQVTMVFQKHLPDFYRRFNIQSQNIADSISDKIYYRIQRNCSAFLDLLNKLEENKSDWHKLSQKPKSLISKINCNTVLKGGNYYYKEYDGKIVNVLVNSNTWTETFEDNTKSNLVIHPKENCEFELEFVESNNETRKNFSVKGDIYNYGFYDIHDGIFDIWVLSKNDNAIYAFKLYSKK